MKSAKMSWRYIAGFYDGEGCFGVYEYDNAKYAAGGSKGTRANIAVNQKTTNNKVLKEISRFLSKHGIRHCIYDCKYEGKHHCMMSYIKMGYRVHMKKFLQKTLPYLIVKKKAGEKILKFCNRK